MHDDTWGGHDWGWAGWTMMSVAMVGVLLLVAVLVALLVRAATWGAGGQRQDPPTDPRSLLDERLARGEIDLEEHAARLSALRHPR